MNFYKYLFYKLYSFVKSVDKRKGAEWGAMNALSILVLTNVGILHNKLFSVAKGSYTSNWKIPLILIGVLIYATNYLLFVHKNGFASIEKQYKNETPTKRRIGTFIVILYLLLTLVSIFL